MLSLSPHALIPYLQQIRKHTLVSLVPYYVSYVHGNGSNKIISEWSDVQTVIKKNEMGLPRAAVNTRVPIRTRDDIQALLGEFW